MHEDYFQRLLGKQQYESQWVTANLTTKTNEEGFFKRGIAKIKCNEKK